MQILKNRAMENISSIKGYNEYLSGKFKDNKKAIFEELMQDTAEEYQPYDPNISYEERAKQQKASLEIYNPTNPENVSK